MAKVKKQKGNTLTNVVSALVSNATLMRSQLVSSLMDPRRDIDIEAGYPKSITPEMYRLMYDREGTASRIVHFWPEECWSLDPQVYETEEPSLTAFEVALESLEKSRNLFHFLQRIDEMSGIGRFGLLLLGIDDGLDLHEPIEGLALSGEIEGSQPKDGRKLLYLRIFSDEVVDVDVTETDKMSPRFGKPILYTIKMTEYGLDGKAQTETSIKVHWSRVIHVADRKEMSEIYGTPRLQQVWNRLLDLQKVMGGSGEMFWKGAFPGYAIETDPSIPDVEINTASMREQLSNYFNGLQRYLALTGVTVKSLTPQIGDPTAHRAAIMDDIAFTMGVPKRKLFGSEQGQLASGQDNSTHNKRVTRRNEKHVSPCIIRPFLNRLIAIGVLPTPADLEYTILWPDLNTVTDQEKADVAAKRTEAFAKYVAGGVDGLIPPEEYLTLIHGMDSDEVSQIVKALDVYLNEKLEDEEERAAMLAEFQEQVGTPPQASAEPTEEPKE